MTEQDIEAALSEAYVYTVAARVGAITSIRSRDYGIDGSFLEVMYIDGQRVECGGVINYQLKASQGCILKDTEIVYKIKKDAYNRLVAIKNNSAVPCILLVLSLPSDSGKWFEINEDYLLLRKCCYWLYWEARTPIDKSSVNLRISRNQQFTPDALNMLFEQYKKGELR
jgi:hypothetical protein